jgi:hypothetical protein
MFNEIGYGLYASGVDLTAAVFNCRRCIIRIWRTCEFLRHSGIDSVGDLEVRNGYMLDVGNVYSRSFMETFFVECKECSRQPSTKEVGFQFQACRRQSNFAHCADTAPTSAVSGHTVLTREIFKKVDRLEIVIMKGAVIFSMRE